MKFVAISDTHGKHHEAKLPKGDVVIHAGDISKRGYPDEIKDFLDWFNALDFRYKIFIAGNHDFFFETADLKSIKKMMPQNIIYLNDNSINIEGIKIWGSPIQPYFYNWAFNRHRGLQIKKHWDLIPHDMDIIVTHGPVANIQDKTIKGENVGCEDLYQTIQKIKPKFYICGHIHEAYGKLVTEETTFINCSLLDVNYQLINAPIEFDFTIQ